MSALATALNSIGVPTSDEPGGFVRLLGFSVHLGRHKGEVVDVAVNCPDYPLTPPAGLHIGAPWGADLPNVSPSPLGPNWRYFSRRLGDWKGRNLPHVLLAYINRVLADA